MNRLNIDVFMENQTTYRFTFERGGKKHICPKCGKRRFVRYVDTKTGELMDDKFGICDRKDNCGYFNTPEYTEFAYGKRRSISKKVMDRTMVNYDQNNFILFLKEKFDVYLLELMRKYHIGTTDRYRGGCIFWYIDLRGIIRSGKIMGYDLSGHRIKGQTNWVHSLMYQDNFEFTQSFYGEHLLVENPNLPVAIVESEKTAIICEGFIPNTYNWISCGSVHGMGGKTLNWEKCRVLGGRDVVLFPDLDKKNDSLRIWEGIAKQMKKKGINARVDYTLQENYTGNMKIRGADLADYLLDHMAHSQIRENFSIPAHLVNTENVDSKFYVPF